MGKPRNGLNMMGQVLMSCGLLKVLLSALAALGAAQSYNGDSKLAAILTEQRYLQTDGKFGASYKQEDGVEFKEESDADGTRHGSYSYVDPTGQRRTVSYTAGKNGFQATGDHIPAAPAPVIRPDPQYNSPVQQQPQSSYRAPAPATEDNGEWVDDTRQWSDSPARANNPQWANTAPQTWTNPQTYAPVQAQWNSNPAPQPQQQWNSNPAPQQQWNSNPAPQQQQWAAPTAAPVYNQPPTQRWSAPLETTPAPHRFFPPGKLNLNRSPDGFSFSFNKA